MASSPGNNTNQNPPPQQPPFDLHKLFKSSTPPPTTTTSNASPNPQIPSPNSVVSSSSSPYPLPSASHPPPQTPPFTYNPNNYPNPYSNQELANVHLQRSMSYPTPTLQPLENGSFQNPQNPSNNNDAHGARLMALLSAPPSTLKLPQINPGSTDLSSVSVSSGPQHQQSPVMVRMPSSKMPKGRHLAGDRVVYDIDVRLPGEVQPQLEVTPITKYGSDPGLVMGRQIAVNKNYICYGLKQGSIRVLNINTALRSLLKGLAQC